MTETERLTDLCEEAIREDDAPGVMACLALLRGRPSRPGAPEALEIADCLDARWKAKQSPAETEGEHRPLAAYCTRCLGYCRCAEDPYDTQPPSERPTMPEMAVWFEDVQP